MASSKKVTKLASGHTVEHLEGDEFEKLKADFKHFEHGAVRFHPGGCLIKSQLLEVADDIYNFEFRPTDVLITSCEKSGSTWLQEILWNMVHNPNLDNPLGRKETYFRCPFFEFDGIFRIHETFIAINLDINAFKENYNLGEHFNLNTAKMFDIMKMMPDPRVLRTHLTPSMLNPKLLDTAKTITIIRNPKDVLLSNYHMCSIANHIGFKGSVNDFAEHFLNGGSVYLPYDEHIREMQKLKGHKNLLFLYYEDLKKDTFAEIKKISEFLGLNLTDLQLKSIVRFTSIGAMKERNESEGKLMADYFKKGDAEGGEGFFRTAENKNRGYVLSSAVEKKFKQWADEKLKDLNLPYKF